MAVADILALISDLIQPTPASENKSTTSAENYTEDELFELSLHGNMKRVQTHYKSINSGNSSLREISETVRETHHVTCLLCADDVETDTETNFDVRWEFARCNLYLLLSLKETIDREMTAYKSAMDEQRSTDTTRLEHTAPPLSPDTLSFDQQKWVLTSVQFIACLGVCPCLQPGVGIPIERRSGLGHVLQWSPRTDGLPVQQKDHRLWFCVRVLIKCSSQPSLGGLLFSCYLGDIMAGLMQLCYGRKMSNTSRKTEDHSTEPHSLEKEMTAMNINDITENAAAGKITNGENIERVCSELPSENTAEAEKTSAENTPDIVELSELDYDEAASELDQLVRRVYQPILVREVLMLQGGAGAAKPIVKQTGKPVSTSAMRAPVWLRKACSQMLTGVLLRPNGVQNVLQGMLDRSTGGPQGDAMEWKKIETVSRIIGTCPSYIESRDDFYRTVAPQILGLLRVGDKLRASRYQQVVSCTLALVLQKDGAVAEKYFISPLMAPLLLCLDDRDLQEVAEPVVLVTETNLRRCLSDLTKIFSIERVISSDLLRILNPVLHVLFQIYCRVKDGVLSIRKPVEDLLLSYMKQSSDSVSALNFFITENTPDRPTFKRMSERVVLTPGGEGGLTALLTPKDSPPELLDGWETSAAAILEILQKVNNTQTTADLFISCLQHLTNIISEETTDGTSENSKKDTALELTDPLDRIGKLRVNLTVLTLLGSMCETFGPSCLKSASHILEFVKATLDRCIQVLDNTEDVAMGTFEGETVTMALGLLSSAFSGEVEMTEDDREKSKSLLPMLQRVKDSYPDPLIKQLAADLSVVIATHGRVIPETLGSRTNDLSETVNGESVIPMKHEDATSREAKKPLVEVISSAEKRSNGNSEEMDVENSSRNSSNGTEVSSFQEAIEQLEDQDLPVRGHALIALRRLIEAKDGETLENKATVLEIFRENIRHGDSYIYLAAIEGLATLSSLDSDGLLPLLVEQFVGDVGASNGESSGVKSLRSAEVRMKIGEVLVKTSKSLGEMAPKYRDLLLRGFLHGAKDQDSHIRASSVSNLGEICGLLTYSLGNHIHEILECITALLRTDPEVEVRRSAAMFTTFLLRGLGAEVLSVLESAVRDLYRLLKLQVAVEKDPTTLLHLQMSLEELDVAMKDFVFPKQTLEKKIHVLNAP